jgi:hypothetical protein
LSGGNGVSEMNINLKDGQRIIRESKVVDNGRNEEKPARYEQHFEDGTVVYSNTVPDHFAFKIEEPIDVT